jgi:hypothetical protein
MNIAPDTPARVPSIVMPPEVPVGTRCPEVIEIGLALESVPTSVAQVSAADAASAPIPTACQAAEGNARNASAASRNTPPLANTWPASGLYLFHYRIHEVSLPALAESG